MVLSNIPQYTLGNEITEKAFTSHDLPLVTYGLPFPRLVALHVQRLGCQRVYALVSGSVARKTPSYQQLKDELGPLLVAERVGVKPHTYWDEVLEMAKDAQAAKADILVTLGGGSVTDAAKLVSLAISNNVTSLDEMGALVPIPRGVDAETKKLKFDIPENIKDLTIPVIVIPTTLSAGEHTHASGATDPRNNAKYQFFTPGMTPKVIVLDPQVTLTTPERTWLSSGVRAIDHSVEGLCSLISTPETEKISGEALSLLVPALLKLKKENFNDLQARFEAQVGARKSTEPFLCYGVPIGGSHGIGHMLGPFGVGHGETSCILLPSVCKYNSADPTALEHQHRTLSVLWSLPCVASVLEARGLKRDTADLSTVLDGVFRELGMPRSLREVGIDPTDEFLEKLAEMSLTDFSLASNPIPLTEKSQVLEILRMSA